MIRDHVFLELRKCHGVVQLADGRLVLLPILPRRPFSGDGRLVSHLVTLSAGIGNVAGKVHVAYHPQD